jgi:hypothetical protein
MIGVLANTRTTPLCAHASESFRPSIAELNALSQLSSPHGRERSGRDLPSAPSSQMHSELRAAAQSTQGSSGLRCQATEKTASTIWQDELAAAAKEVSACLDDLRRHQVTVDAASAVAWKPVMPVPSHMKYRGQVELIAIVQDDAARKCSKAAVCCVNDTHLTLFGGAELDQTLLALPLAHLIVEAHAAHATVMSIRAPTAGTRFEAIDTRIFLQVPSATARHRWLTVFQTRSVPVEGAFESQLQISSPRRRRGAYALSAHLPLVTWICSTPPLESVPTHARPRQLKLESSHVVQASRGLREEEEEVENHCNPNLPLNGANAFDLKNFNSLKEYLLKHVF